MRAKGRLCVTRSGLVLKSYLDRGGGELCATDGICTHGKTHLAEGLIFGKMIEWPKHNGRFNFEGGSPARKPGCKAFKTH